MSQFQQFSVEEDDHQLRMEACRAFFADLLTADATSTTIDVPATHDQVLVFLRDRWSVIRQHAARSLEPLLLSLCTHTHKHSAGLALRERLLETLRVALCGSHETWQDLHGDLLGCAAVVHALLHSLVGELAQTCVSLLAHVRIPVRDAARETLVRLAAHSAFRAELSAKILCTIESKMRQHEDEKENEEQENKRANVDMIAENESERVCERNSERERDRESDTLQIDGLLGVLADLSSLLLHTVSPQRLARILRWSMRHAASTVRQRAGSVLSAAMKALLRDAFTHTLSRSPPISSTGVLSINDGREINNNNNNSEERDENTEQQEPSTTCDRLSFFTEEVLMNSLRESTMDCRERETVRETERESWECVEVCLIVTEEVLRETLTLFLSRLAQTQTQTRTYRHAETETELCAALHTLRGLCVCLQKETSRLLAHPRFEVRRVSLQLLPTLARAIIVMGQDWLTDIHICAESETEYSSSFSLSFLLLSDALWLCVLLRESRHIHDVLAATAASLTIEFKEEDKDGEEEESPVCVAPPGEQWAIEVHGRLLEVELRQEFRSLLNNVCATGKDRENKEGLQVLCDALVGVKQTLLRMLLRYYDSFDVVHTHSHTQTENRAHALREQNAQLRVLSVDFVELFALSRSLCFTVQHRLRAVTRTLQLSLSHTTERALCTQASEVEVRLQHCSASWFMLLAVLHTRTQRPPPLSLTHLSTQSVSARARGFLEASEKKERSALSEIMSMWLFSQQQNRHQRKHMRADSEREFELVSLCCDSSGDISLAPSLYLASSLSDPATNPSLLSEIAHTTCAAQTNAPQNTVTQSPFTPHHIAIDTLTETETEGDNYVKKGNDVFSSPPRPVRDANSLVLSPSLPRSLPDASQSTPVSLTFSRSFSRMNSPNRVGMGCDVPLSRSGCSDAHMQRFCCEALSPLLFTLCSAYASHTQVHACTDTTRTQTNTTRSEALLLLYVASEWQLQLLRNPLWLDNRKFAKRTLSESIAVLATLACDAKRDDDITEAHAADTDSTLCMDTPTRDLLVFSVLCVLSDLLSLELRVQKIDVKSLCALVRATHTLLSHIRSLSHSRWCRAEETQRKLLQRCFRFPSDLVTEMIAPTRETLLDAVSQLLVRHAVVENPSVPPQPDSIPSLFQKKDNNDVDGSKMNVDECVASASEDDFSDWDDEDDSDADECASATSSLAATPAAPASLLLAQSLESLRQAVLGWEYVETKV